MNDPITRVMKTTIKRLINQMGFDVVRLRSNDASGFRFERSTAKVVLEKNRTLFEDFFCLSAKRILQIDPPNKSDLGALRSDINSILDRELSIMRASNCRQEDVGALEFVKHIVARFATFDSTNGDWAFPRCLDYIDEIQRNLGRRTGVIWEIGANLGELSLLLQTLGHHVIPTDRVSSERGTQDYGYGSADWIRNHAFGFEHVPLFSYTPCAIANLAGFCKVMSFDVITCNANSAIYSAARGQQNSDLDSVLISHLSCFHQLLSEGGIFQSRSEPWYYDVNGTDARIERLKLLGVKLNKALGVTMISAGLDPYPIPVNSRGQANPLFNMRLVFQRRAPRPAA